MITHGKIKQKVSNGDDLRPIKEYCYADTNIKRRIETIETAYKNIEKLKAKLESLDKKNRQSKMEHLNFQTLLKL